MTNQVAATEQRKRVPTEWQIVFQDWTNASLLSLSNDDTAPPNIRAYAGWELDYRIAFDITVEDPPMPDVQGKGFIEEVLKARRESNG